MRAAAAIAAASTTLLVALASFGCASAPSPAKPSSTAAGTDDPVGPPPTTAPTGGPADAPAVAPVPAPRKLEADTPSTTVGGNTFIAPAGWSLSVRGAATIVEAPEPGSVIALVDVPAAAAATADAAVAAGWAAYAGSATPKWPLKVVNKLPDRDGWFEGSEYTYQTSPNERRDVFVHAKRAGAGGPWTIAIYDMAQAVAEKRGGQMALVYGRLLPKDYTRESFAGKTPHPLDAARIAELGRFVSEGQKALGVPGVAIGLIQGGKVVFSGGFGVRDLSSKQKPDGNTLFMIASNTKALTTLLLAKLVDEKRITWDDPVTSKLPSFKLGDDETTRQVLIKHLICACTGLPRQDLEWLLQFKGVTPEAAMATLGTIQPTSKFGEMFQYSNLLAGAAGFVAGHVAFPKLELGAAYDKAMQTKVFGPLGMKATTFDYARALRGNHATAHAPDVDGKPAHAVMAVNYSIIPLRPAGAAWSNINDMLKYVAMELAAGALPGGKRFIGQEALQARTLPQVSMGKDAVYGMGLEVETTYGVPVVHHGGDMIGYHSDMIWLPEQQVGAVVLTNADPGWILRTQFRRKLLEVLFDGHPEADAAVATQARTFYDQLAADRKLMTIPADPSDVAKLAPHYSHPALGDITVRHEGPATIFDFGEFQSEVASRHNPDGTISFLTTVPGFNGLELVVGPGPQPTLVLRDAQHEYTFESR